MSIMLQLFRLEHYYIYFMNIVEEDSGATTTSFYKSIEITTSKIYCKDEMNILYEMPLHKKNNENYSYNQRALRYEI